MEFPFYDLPNTAAIVCSHVLNGEKPILYVFHDEDDGMWQFLCDGTHTMEEAKIVSLKFVYDLDHSVGALRDMPCGCYAKRAAQTDEWTDLYGISSHKCL